MIFNNALTQKELKQVLSYNPNTGIFTWIRPRQGMLIGHVAGTDKDGYTNIYVNHKPYRAHRLAWLYMTGKFPLGRMRLLDGVKNNCRWDNLTLAEK